MKKIKKIIEIIRYNINTLIGFECAFKIGTFFIFTPLFFRLFDLIMKATGYKYLTLENISSFLLNPLTFSMIILLILLMMVYTMFDIATIIVILDSSLQKRKIKITEAIKTSLDKCKNLLKIKNIPLAFLVLFLIPFFHIGISSSFISTIKIPEFILEFILKNKILFLLFFLLIAILFLLLLHWLYAIPYFLLENCNFKEARKKSASLGKRKHIQDLLSLCIIQCLNAFIYFFFLMFGISIILILKNALENILILKSFATTIIWGLVTMIALIVMGLSTPISYAGITVMFYFHKTEKKEEIQHIVKEEKNKEHKNKKLKKIFAGIGLLALILGNVFIYKLYLGQYNLKIEYARTIEVTAHRGDSLNYPENTMSAFWGAKNLGADWIELDVQQTKDDKIIVMHDKNFKRTAGVNKNTRELTCEEVKELDVGSFFDEKYKGEKIPLLEEVITFAKENNMKLNIELKPAGEETDFEKNVLDVIKKLNFAENCVIASQTYSVLENVKKIDSQIKTVYVMSLAYGDIISFKDADIFSIEASNITSSLVKKVHQEGKELYSWTVNTEENIKKMIDLQIDNIITDNILLARDTIYASKTSDFINEYINFIENLF